MKQLKRTSAITINTRENNARFNHTYRVGDKVLILLDQKEINGKMNQPTEGPYEIIKVNLSNGTVKIARGNYNETIHIRRLKPYHD